MLRIFCTLVLSFFLCSDVTLFLYSGFKTFLCSDVKVARVVNIKLVYADSFFYNLTILIKQCKIQYLSLDRTLLFPRNHVFHLKNWKLTSSNYHRVKYFLLKFPSRYLLNNVYKKVFGVSFILLRSWVNKNIKKLVSVKV